MLTRIAITGGPSGGKTTLIDTIKKDLRSFLGIVPEAASILYRGGFPRRATTENKVHGQRAIYYIQKELEELIAHEHGKKTLVCDRGSLDGIAYWPYTEEDFFNSLGSTRDQELRRYRWVIHLDTAPFDQYDESNPVRVESYSEAIAINDKIKEAWRNHPQRFIIPEDQDFLSKMNKCIFIVKSILGNKDYNEILKSIEK